MKIKVCVITGSVADYGILKPLCKKISTSKKLKLDLIVTGSHLSEIHGLTITEIEKDFSEKIHKVEILLANSNKKSIIKSCSLALLGISDLLDNLNPDIIVILGDRYEILMAANASMLLGIPLAHIHGGEISEGSIDDKMRHSITKLSNLHFVSCEEHKKRVIQLGESPNRVFNVGALGIENLVKLKTINKQKIFDILSINIKRDNLFIVAIHPETVDQGKSQELAKNLSELIKNYKDTIFIWTLPNADESSSKMREIIKENTNKLDHVFLFESLGSDLFLNCLKISDGIIGNSSSGIIEAPYFKVGTLNIGIRQKGRVKTTSIINCSIDKLSIKNAIDKLKSKNFKIQLKNTKSLYGLGDVSNKIMDVLEDKKLYLNSDKVFFDI